MSPKWVIEAGHAITRDIPPSVINWRRYDLYPRNMTFAKALRLLFLYHEIFTEYHNLRIRNVETEETYGAFPCSISYTPHWEWDEPVVGFVDPINGYKPKRS